jgi:hypothetical protein
MADLGFSHLYFSCKNYQKLAQASITKVVGFLTMNPTKLGLYFSDISTIFYGFYKSLQITNTIGVTACSQPPRFSADSQIGPYFAVRTLGSSLTLQ